MTSLALGLVALSLLSSPLASSAWCPAGQGDVLLGHELSHDAGYWVQGMRPPHQLALSGDKWGEGASAPQWAGGLVGETWLAAATLDHCTSRAHTLSVGAYTLRAILAPSHAGDFGPPQDRGRFGAAALGSAILIEAVAEFQMGGRR